MYPTLHDYQTFPASSYASMSPYPSTIASIDPTNDNAIFPSFEALGPPMDDPSTSMSTSSSPYSYLLSDHTLTSLVGSPHSTHSPSQDDPAFYLSVDQILLLADLPSPADSDGGVAGSPTVSSPFHGYSGPHTFSGGAWQSPALPTSEYVAPPNAAMALGYYYQPGSMDALTPPFPGESQPLPDSLALNVDVHVLPTAQLSHLSSLPSSSTVVSPYHPFKFVDDDGVTKYQCPLCPKRIKNRSSNFRDHLETHSPHRARFDCDWPGCDLPFTRERDQRRHIEEDHLVTRTKKIHSKAPPAGSVQAQWWRQRKAHL